MPPLQRWKLALACLGALLAPSPLFAAPAGPSPFDAKAFEAKLREDSQVIQTYRKKISYIADYILMDAVPPEGLKKESYRGNLRETWVGFLDYLIALDSISRSYHPYLNASLPSARKAAFDTSYWIFLAEYRYAAEFVKNLEGLPDIGPILNGPIPELDLPSGTYTAFKAMVQGGEKTAELFGKDKAYFSFGTGDLEQARLSQTREDKNAVLHFCSPLKLAELKKMGEEKPNPNNFSPWVPFFKDLPVWGGRSNPWKAERTAFSSGQVEFLLNHLEPGDILLSRRECYFSGVGRPGYWSQAALYIGDETLRNFYFNDASMNPWLAGRGRQECFEDFLKKEFHDRFPECLNRDGKGHTPRILEASAEGVLFSPLERFAEADALCVLRPRLTKPEKANALLRAFRCLGKPFDFNFDDESDGEMTGSELLAFSYKADGKFPGLKFLLREMLGNYFSSPNAIVERFDGQFGTPDQQMDLVAFLDFEPKSGRAEFNGLGELRQSWKKPKWSSPLILLP